jgi:hypothetical protein
MGFRTCAPILGVLIIVSLAVIGGTESPKKADAFGVDVIVTTNDDNIFPDQECSLREAIMATNNNSKVNGCDAHQSTGPNGIDFDIGTGTPVINVTTPLPTITATLLTMNGGSKATRVELHGPYSGTPVSGHDGLDISGSFVTIKNMVIDNFEDDGIKVTGWNFALTGSYIGTNIDGTAASGNAGFGVQMTAPNATIEGLTDGGPCTGDCNLISGNAKTGVFFDSGATSGFLRGSFIGTDASGTIALPNGFGGVEVKATTVDIGSTRQAAACTDDCNLISGNNGNGILFDASATGNRAIGNYIGTDITGAVPLGNSHYGVDVASPGFQLGWTGGTTPGGSCTSSCNLIAANGTAQTAGTSYTNVEFEATATGGLVEGNFVGLNGTGTAHLSNGQDLQQGIEDYGSGLTIGGTDPTFRNVLSGESAGEIIIYGNDAKVKGNYIGVNSAGTAAIPMSGTGMYVFNVTGTVIGGATPSEGNVISGSGAPGQIGISLVRATGAVIERNLIGTAADGISPVPNAFAGVSVQVDSHDVTIGGSDPNTIMFNGKGVFVGGGPIPDRIRITGNSIDDNTGKGIELGNGANHNQAAPVIASVQNDTNTTTHVVLSLTSAPNTDYQVDLYDSPVCDPSGYGEGRTHGATETVHTDGSGVGHLDKEEAQLGAAGTGVTATATDTNGNTSEFSNCVDIQGQATPTPSPTPAPSPTATATPIGQTPSPTPTPTPVVTPTPTPLGTSRIWGDIDCGGDIAPRDAQAILKNVLVQSPLSQTEPCPNVGSQVTVDGVSRIWGDVDCGGDIAPRDAQAILKNVLVQNPLNQTQPCPAVGSTVTVVS